MVSCFIFHALGLKAYAGLHKVGAFPLRYALSEVLKYNFLIWREGAVARGAAHESSWVAATWDRFVRWLEVMR
jgi:hypothetical protein